MYADTMGDASSHTALSSGMPTRNTSISYNAGKSVGCQEDRSEGIGQRCSLEANHESRLRGTQVDTHISYTNLQHTSLIKRPTTTRKG